MKTDIELWILLLMGLVAFLYIMGDTTDYKAKKQKQ